MIYCIHILALFTASVVCVVALRQLGSEQRARTKRALCGVALLSILHIGMKAIVVFPQLEITEAEVHPLWAPIDLLNLVVLLALVQAVKRSPRK